MANAFALPTIGQRQLRSTNHISLIDMFLGDLIFPTMALSFSAMQLPELPQTTNRYLGILGRDILDQGALRIDGRTREIMITF